MLLVDGISYPKYVTARTATLAQVRANGRIGFLIELTKFKGLERLGILRLRFTSVCQICRKKKGGKERERERGGG